MADTTIGGIATAVVTVDPTDLFETEQAGATKKVTAQKLLDFFNYDADMWIRLDAARALTSSTAEQKIFASPTNGRLTLTTGVYFFESVISLSAMSTTSGNAAFDILGAGTAVLTSVLYQASAGELAINTPGAGTIVNVNQGQTPAAITTAGVTANLQIIVTGTFEVSTAGTIVPSLTLATAAAASLAAGTYFRCRRVAAVNVVSGGPWD